ncbi:ligand-binding sensor domain-containing protein [Arcticibacter eurypsychrophilus]|uniref:ligand-binding sensor domain-containing protein n=1 Tax=Arcticibacter eurypsychrophilus TaxID=1434752 RepID=UPI00084CFF0C|nr:two-component regulator propeller domain-containing protein [Arcticibacter eurypsychrophilus]
MDRLFNDICLKVLIRYLLLSLLFLSSITVFAETLNFKNYTVKDGLANSNVYSIFQDRKGFIWIATEGGVNRFDGERFELFTMDNGLSDNEVLEIHQDSKGKIWFLTLNGKLSYYWNGKFYNASNDPVLEKTAGQGSYTSFFEDSTHRLWFSTNRNNILSIDPGNKVSFFSSPTHSFVNAFLFETLQHQVAALSEHFLFFYKNNKFIKTPLRDYPLSSKSITHEKTTNEVYFLSATLLLKLRGKEAIPLAKIKGLKGLDVGSFLLDKKEMWIGTMGKGLYHYKSFDKQPEHYLNNYTVSHILRDKQGNTWFSTIGNGIFMLPYHSNFIRHFTEADGLAANAINQVYKINDKLILGYNDGNVDLIQQSKIKKFVLHSDHLYNPVQDFFFEKKSGSFWYGSENSLIEIQKNGEYQHYLNDPKWVSYALKSFSVSNSNKIAVALASGVYILNKNLKKGSSYPPTNLLKSTNFPNRAYCVFYDSSNGLWFSNLQGLHYYKFGKLEALYKKYPLLNQRITDVAEIPGNMIVCSTYGFGVLVLKNFKLIHVITVKNGLSSNICKNLFVEGQAAWVVTGKGISKIKFNSSGYSIANYNSENGLLSNEINDLYVDHDTAYVASNSGLTIFKETERAKQLSLPNVIIRSIEVNKDQITLKEAKDLNYKQNNITVNFISLDYTHPREVIYSYRLDKSSPWTETIEKTIEFSALEPGQYCLELRARSMNSAWTLPTQLVIYISGPYYKSWWFIVAILLMVTLTLFFLIRYYYRVKQNKEKEELLVKSHIISLEQQALQAMMNPHFIFNVMNSIQYFINTKDNTMANQLLTGFARLIRKNLDICTKSYISVEEELSYLKLYLSLEKLRFGEKMSYSIQMNTDIDLQETYIPSMLLQPYVENAIWHGLMPMDNPGEIIVTLTNNKQELLLIIQDNGVGIDNSINSKSSDHVSRGMKLTQQRISLLNKFNQDSISISVAQIASGGTLVRVKIPLKPFTHS